MYIPSSTRFQVQSPNIYPESTPAVNKSSTKPTDCILPFGSLADATKPEMSWAIHSQNNAACQLTINIYNCPIYIADSPPARL